jgi:type IV pilus assembly protein PilO
MANLDLKNPALQKRLLAGTVAVGLLLVFFLTHVLPFGFPTQQERVNALMTTYQKKATDLARAKTTVADLPRFEAEYGQLHEQWVLAAELLPTDKDLPTLLRKISLSGQQTGITFMMFRPTPPKAQTYYSEMPVNVVVQGGYHQVGSFLAELANLRRIVTVSDMRLKSTTKADDPNLTTSAEFTASAYSLNTTPVAPPAAADNTKKKSDADHQGETNGHKGS